MRKILGDVCILRDDSHRLDTSESCSKYSRAASQLKNDLFEHDRTMGRLSTGNSFAIAIVLF